MGIYHYTNFENAMKIIKSEQLWLTHISYLNDKSEFIYCSDILFEFIRKKETELTEMIIKEQRKDGNYQDDINFQKRHFLVFIKVALLAEFYSGIKGEKINSDYFIGQNYSKETSAALEEQNKIFKKVYAFIASFSLIPDDLTLWRLYSNNSKGACIEFDLRNSDNIGNNSNYILLKDNIKYLERNEIYDDFEQILNREIKNIEQTYKNNGSNCENENFLEEFKMIHYNTYEEILLKILFTKRKDFDVEKEFRIVYLCDEENLNTNNEKFEVLSIGEKIKPVIKLEIDNNYINIKRLILGPNNEYNGDNWAINSLLKNKNVELIKSNIDYYR